jgi:acyl carrier protein
MDVTPDTTRAEIKAYILEEFLPGEDPGSLQDSTPLITTGILDSIATVKLISFLSEHFGVDFEAYEVSADNLNTIADIARVIDSKRAGQ